MPNLSGRSVTENSEPQDGIGIDGHSGQEEVSLESILLTEELRRRPSRPPDFEKEINALVALSDVLADSPLTILQTLADTILAVCQCGQRVYAF